MEFLLHNKTTLSLELYRVTGLIKEYSMKEIYPVTCSKKNNVLHL